MSNSNAALNLPEPHEEQRFKFPAKKEMEHLILRLSQESSPVQEEGWSAGINLFFSHSREHMKAEFDVVPHGYLTYDMTYYVYQGRLFEECRRAIDELRRTAKEPNWDSEDAEPVSDEALSVALKVAATLPRNLPAPDIYPDPEGRIEFDWALDNGTSFTLTVGPKGDAAMSARRTKGGFLRGWSKNDDDNDALPDLVAFSLSWLEKMAAK